MENLNLLLERLLKAQVDFVLVGGYAAVLHGSSQVTHDLDICAVMTEPELSKLKSALIGLDARHRMNPSFQPPLEDYPKRAGEIKNFFLKTKAGVLDILDEVAPAGTFEEIKRRSIGIKLFGHDCRVISLDDLIRVKQSMNRPKDRFVLEELMEIKNRLK